MFSSTAQIAPMEDGEEEESLGNNSQDLDASESQQTLERSVNQDQQPQGHDEQEGDDEGHGGGGFFSMFARKEEKFVDPPMPYMGPPLRYRSIVDRVQKAKPVAKKILDLCRVQVSDSVLEGSTIPVDKDTERIKVSADQSARIGQKRTMVSLRSSLESTFSEITRILNWRRIAVDMMNHNTSNVVVRKIGKIRSYCRFFFSVAKRLHSYTDYFFSSTEPIDTAESRSVLSTRPDGKQDSDLW
jgi:hypothetical protein